MILLLAAVPLSVAGLLFIQTSQNVLRRDIKSIQLEVANRVAGEADHIVGCIAKALASSTQTKGFLEGDEERQRVILEKLPKSYENIIELSLIDEVGREKIKISRYRLITPEDLRDRAGADEFTTAIKGKNYVSPVWISESAEPCLTIAVPVRLTEKEIMGVLSAEVHLKPLWDLVSDLRVGESGYVYVVDKGGRIVAHPDVSLVLKETIIDNPHVGEIRAGKSDTLYKEYLSESGESVVGSHLIVEELGWGIIVEQPTAEAYASLNQMRLRTLGLLLATLAVALFMGIYYARRIAKPIEVLYEGAEIIEKGDLEHRIEVKTGDELEELAEEFNRMSESLKRSKEELEEWGKTLEQKVGERTEEIRHRVKELTTLFEVSKVVSSTLELEELLKKILDTVLPLIKAQAGGFFLLDMRELVKCWEFMKCGKKECPAYGSDNLECWAIPGTICRDEVHEKIEDKIRACCARCPLFKGIKLKPAVVCGLDERSVQDVEIGIGESFCGQALLECRPTTAEGSSCEAGLCGVIARKPELKNQVVLPLMTKGEVVGVLVLGTQRPHPWTTEEISLLSAVADEVAVAIENSQLYVDAKRAAVEFRSIYEMSKALGGTLEIKSLLDLILHLSLDMLGGDKASIMLLDEEKGELTIEAAAGLSEEAIKQTRLKLGEGIAGLAAEKGEPLLISDISKDPRFKGVRKREDICSALCVPLKVKGMVIGVLNVGAVCPHMFTEGDLRIISTVAGQAAIAIHNARLFTQLEELYLATVKAFVAAIEAKDPYTRGHSERVTSFSLAMAERLGLSGRDMEDIRTAALLHDVGKIGVKEEILNKTTSLTDEEYRIVKMHPLIATKIVEQIPLLADVIPIIAHHHERYDGNGYLDGLAGEEIPLGARILAVADAFDAMISERPYHSALSFTEAVGELKRNAGSQFDPKVVEAFCEVLEKPQFGKRFKEAGLMVEPSKSTRRRSGQAKQKVN